MRVINKGKGYKVYMLTFPNGKSYIGYTGERLIETRIAKGYNHNRRISRALKQYAGQLKIYLLADNLTKTEAEAKEIYFISLYQTTTRRKGYNYSKGGAGGRNGCKLTAKQRAAISGDNNPNRIATARKKINRAFKQMKAALNFNPAAQLRAFDNARKAMYINPLDNMRKAQERMKQAANFNHTEQINKALNFDITERVNEAFNRFNDIKPE